MEEKREKTPIWILVLICSWLIIFVLAAGFLFELHDSNYKMKFIHNCCEDSVDRLVNLLKYEDCEVNIYDKYCGLCGGAITSDSILIYKDSYCSGCGRNKVSNEDYCNYCGSKYTDAEFVSLESSPYKDIDTIKLLKVIKIICTVFVVLTIILIIGIVIN